MRRIASSTGRGILRSIHKPYFGGVFGKYYSILVLLPIQITIVGRLYEQHQSLAKECARSPAETPSGLYLPAVCHVVTDSSWHNGARSIPEEPVPVTECASSHRRSLRVHSTRSDPDVRRRLVLAADGAAGCAAVGGPGFGCASRFRHPFAGEQMDVRVSLRI